MSCSDFECPQVLEDKGLDQYSGFILGKKGILILGRSGFISKTSDTEISVISAAATFINNWIIGVISREIYNEIILNKPIMLANFICHSLVSEIESILQINSKMPFNQRPESEIYRTKKSSNNKESLFFRSSMLVKKISKSNIFKKPHFKEKNELAFDLLQLGRYRTIYGSIFGEIDSRQSIDDVIDPYDLKKLSMASINRARNKVFERFGQNICGSLCIEILLAGWNFEHRQVFYGRLGGQKIFVKGSDSKIKEAFENHAWPDNYRLKLADMDWEKHLCFDCLNEKISGPVHSIFMVATGRGITGKGLAGFGNYRECFDDIENYLGHGKDPISSSFKLSERLTNLRETNQDNHAMIVLVRS
jgi:hypothetical protein